MNKLKKFINNFITNKDNIELNGSTLNDYENKVIQALIRGESFFEKLC